MPNLNLISINFLSCPQLTVEADTGIILACEGDSAAALFGAESRDKLVGVPLASLIPNARLPSYDAPMPKNMAKQKLTGISCTV